MICRFVGIGGLAWIYAKEVQRIELFLTDFSQAECSYPTVSWLAGKGEESWPSRDEVIVVTLSRPRQGESSCAGRPKGWQPQIPERCLEVGSVSSSVSEVSDARRYPSFCRDWGEPTRGDPPQKFACDPDFEAQPARDSYLAPGWCGGASRFGAVEASCQSRQLWLVQVQSLISLLCQYTSPFHVKEAGRQVHVQTDYLESSRQ